MRIGHLNRQDAEGLRAHALAQTFIDYAAHDGEVYRRVWIGDVPGLQGLIESAMGSPVDVLMMGYRLNFAGEAPNSAIHSDVGWGTHALVLYLCDGEGGTAFWRHRETGETRLRPEHGDIVKRDCGRADNWEMVALCPLAFGRAVIYEGDQFHSRYPFEAFGDRPENGRLIAVAFFTPKEIH